MSDLYLNFSLKLVPKPNYLSFEVLSFSSSINILKYGPSFVTC